MKDSKLFCCFSVPLRDFLAENNVKYEICALNEKSKKTNLEKYGVDNPLKSEEIQEKIKKTLREKYGVDSPR